MRPPGDYLGVVAELSSLDDPVRRRLYEYVASRKEPVARDDAASATGISRSLAAYHLDKLAEANVLAVSYARPSGRTGPGAGRPAKRYARSQHELTVSVPPRNYGLLAGLLAAAVTDADAAGATGVEATAEQLARQAGHDAATGTGLLDDLRRCGYEPDQSPSGEIELCNCPFHAVAQQNPELVCALNLQLTRGLLEAAGEAPERAVLDPQPGRCCVVIHPAD